MKRLKKATGRISSLEAGVKGKNSLEKPALLVHSGPNGEEMTLESADGPISFDEARIRKIVKNHNKFITKLANDYGGLDKMPIGAFPPSLDQHESDSVKRVVGRLNSLVKFEWRDVPGVGKNCACVCIDKITFLDPDIIEMVEDGRAYHLSIGIDETQNILTETSLVIEPAAPGAMLLKKGKQPMSVKRLAAHKKKMKHLSAVRDSLKGITTKVVKTSEAVTLARKKATVTHRLTGLMRSGKITPAEFKKMDVKRLAKLPDAELNTMMDTFAALEPKVLAGQRGTTSAMHFSSFGKELKKKEHKQLKSEIKKDIMRLSGKKLKDEDGDDDKDLSGFGAEETKKLEGEEEGGDVNMSKHLELMQETQKQLEEGNFEKAKLCHMEAMKCAEEMHGAGEKHLEIGEEANQEMDKANTDFQKQIDEINSQVARIAGIVEELYSAEEEEGHDLEEEASEEEKHLAEEEEEKRLAAEKEAKEEEEKKLKKLEDDKEEEEKKKLAAKEEEEKKLAAEEEEKKRLQEELKKK